MKRQIKTIYLKDGKQIFYPSDNELKKIWNQIETIEITERYSIKEWNDKYVFIRSYDSDEKVLK